MNLLLPLLGCGWLLGTALAAGADPAAPASGADIVAQLPHTAKLIAGHQPVRVVLYGDSISEVKTGWSGGASKPDKNWGAVLVQRLSVAYPQSAFTVQHFAIGGQNSYEGLGRLDGLAAYKPDLVLLAFGANDCCYHYLQPAETQLALTTLATEIRARTGADVVLLSTAGDNPRQTLFQHTDETVAAQRQAAATAKVLFVDLRAAVLAATANGRDWADYHLNAGNCHPNDAGHGVWATAVLAVLQAALNPPVDAR